MPEIAAVALIAGGTGLKMYGDYQAAGAQEKAAENAQDTAMRNRQIALAVAGRNAEASRRDTKERIRLQQANAKKVMGERRLAFGAAGSSGGTAFEFMAGEVARDEMNRAAIDYTGKVQAQNILFQGDMAAWQYQTQATDYGNQARTIAKAKKLQALGTLLQGGASAFMAYGALKSSGGGTSYGANAEGGFADYYPSGGGK